MDEKKIATASATAVEVGDNSDASTVEQASNRPVERGGILKHFPIFGFGMLFAVLLCTTASIIVLVLSDGVSKNVWHSFVAPNVLINIFNAVGNICFAIAIGNGIAISWWRMARKGAAIEDLHRSLSINTFLKQVAHHPSTIKHFNLIALAALTAKLAIVDSTLLQKAFSTQPGIDPPQDISISGRVYTDYPLSGRIAGKGDNEYGVMSPELGSALKVWAIQPKSLPNYFTGCDGFCFPIIEAIGFEVDCSEEFSTDINYAQQVHRYASSNVSELDSDNSLAPLFQLSFEPASDEKSNSYLTMTSIHTQSSAMPSEQSSCPGILKNQTCSLFPALVQYPIMLQHFDDWGSHDPDMQIGPDLNWWKSPALNYTPVYDPKAKQLHGYSISKRLLFDDEDRNTSSSATGQTHLAGILQAFNTYLAGSTDLYYSEGLGYDLDTDGVAPYYLTNEPNITQCDYKFDDPISPAGNSGVETVIQKINEIMFTFATDPLFDSTTVPPTGFENVSAITLSIHYESDYNYMAGAIISTLICMILILPSYWGYWEIGRKVSLNPFEIAHAFGAPITAHVQDQTEDGLIKEMGPKGIKYGPLQVANTDNDAVSPTGGHLHGFYEDPEKDKMKDKPKDKPKK